MLFYFNIFGIISIIGAIFALAFFYYSFTHERNVLTLTLSCLTLATFGYILFSAFEPSVSLYSVKLFSNYATSLLYPFVFVLWVLFILNYLKPEKINKRDTIAILIIPILIVFAIITDPFLHLFYNYVPQFIAPDQTLDFSRNVMGVVGNIFGAIMGVLSLILPIYYYHKVEEFYKRPILFFILAVLFPIIGAVIYFLGIYNDFDLVAFGCVFGVITLFSTFVHYGVFNVVPVAHNYFIEQINVGMIYFNDKNCLMDFNPAAKEILSLTEDNKNKRINDIFTNPVIIDFLNSSRKSVEVYDDKNDKWYEFISNEVADEDLYYGNVYTIMDITRVKKAQFKAIQTLKEVEQQRNEAIKKEEELNEINNENVILLQEVHHRVRNNLQLILSFLNLDKRFGVKTADEIINSTLSRVTSMSITYQQAYENDKISLINFGDFIENNINKFLNIYEVEGIETILDVDKDISVCPNVFSPLTLIFNELLSNSVNYAYEEDQDKKLFITLKKIDDDTAYLIIEDNGKGLDESIDINSSKTLGFTLIKLLSHQVDGKIEKLPSEGTSIKIEFTLRITNEGCF